ncbi:glycoside hydrolase family 127 protein [Gracilibacillus dipsosauri]|uniref:glycoside hydrolase family 127 protein n=1 Tax=Gracilibacillus dipsosauri TaxID=178340 RepID=UPI002409AB69
MKQTRCSEVSFTNVTILDGFWKDRFYDHQKTTLRASLDKCWQTGRIDNFSKAGGLMSGDFEGIFFNDSDVYKVLEGVAYSLANQYDSELECEADDIIDRIASAQEEDGYLMTYYTLVEPENKWTDMDKHEMYCGGHLIEAAIAYKHATGKDKLLGVACRLVDHYDTIFGPSKRHWVPGHEEIELALTKLYQETSEKRYLDLAIWLLEQRGRGLGEGAIWNKEDWGPAYCQDDQLVREIEKVKGHAVRAMYLYTAMSEVARLTEKEDYLAALDRVWENVITKNMYITGGIGSSHHNEGFTKDYDLPNETAYCETCASAGMIFWNHRMNLLYEDAKYADIVETELYNGLLSGVSLDGRKFFYDNPLASNGQHHRVEWFGTSCCPTQLARFIPSIGNYLYSVSNDTLYINQFIHSKSNVTWNEKQVSITQKTNYPWDGKIDLQFDLQSESSFELAVRLPGWCNQYRLLLNGELLEEYQSENGYVKINRVWHAEDRITLDLHMEVEKVYSSPAVRENVGKVALRNGPLVYAFEGVDHLNRDLERIFLSDSSHFTTKFDESILSGVSVIKSNALYVKDECLKEPLYHSNKPDLIPIDIKAVPYYSWNNRGNGQMRVWLNHRI